MHLLVHPFHDRSSGVIAYVVTNPASDRCALVDAHLLGSTDGADASATPLQLVIEFVRANGLVVEWMLATRCDTQAVDTIRALKRHFVCAQLGARAASMDSMHGESRSQDAVSVQSRSTQIGSDGSHSRASLRLDRVFGHGERVSIGHACGRVLHTADRAPGSVVYSFDGVAFTGAAALGPGGSDRREPDSELSKANDHGRSWMQHLAPNTRLFVGVEGSLANAEVPCMTFAGGFTRRGSCALDRLSVAP
ncbi:MAG: hypothetical protein ACO3Z6_02880 [Pseudomonadales bacterium]